ncbi:MAG: PAS domain S-box protein [Alphaproteobacteria bacterium]|nr:PAS domain S-box protein [Alphaproteobacteria bacterium]
MAGPATKTLEDLRKSAGAAWLWDGMRARLVWANAAGIKAFDGQSVFDLIDRVFDPQESGVAQIADLTKTLKRDEVRKLTLEFPSSSQQSMFECECWLHTLADGRAGLLVHVPVGLSTDTGHADVFVQLPVAVLLLAKDGAITRHNAMAANLFDVATIKSLSGLLGNAGRAEGLLTRLQATSLVSAIESFEGLYGRREARLTLRRLAGESQDFAALVMDDITERRSMERQLADAPTPQVVVAEISQKPVDTDAQAFEALARSLNDAIAKVEEKPRAEEPIAKTSPKKLVAGKANAQPPRAIASALESTGVALIISQNQLPAFASQKAALLLGFDRAEDLLNSSMLLEALPQMEKGLFHWQLPGDRTILCEVVPSSIPWINGPARQFVLRASSPPILVDKKEYVKAKAAPVSNTLTAPAEVAAVEPPQLETASSVAEKTAVPAEMPHRPRETEDELQSILDIASDGIITLDEKGFIISFSAGAESIFGLRSAEVKSKPIADYFAGESKKALQHYLAGLQGPGLGAVFNGGREVVAIVRQGGTVPLFLTIGKLQSSASGAAFCAVVRDITSWKRTEKELREAKEAAEAASKQKSEFLARISHELRTPLNAIMGFSDIMRLEQFGALRNEKYRGYINDIHASGSHLLALINDLLDLSKIEAGKMELNFTAVNVQDCADHAIKLLQETATRARVLVRKSFPEKLPRVVADLRAMRQVMINLLSNAIKFTDPGGQVIISASVTSGGELALKLKDTGIGMNADQLNDALEPFKRVDTPGRETQGTGLGLPLTKALVEANRASFTISSDPGQGTLIEITFPTTRVLAE